MGAVRRIRVVKGFRCEPTGIIGVKELKQREIKDRNMWRSRCDKVDLEPWRAEVCANGAPGGMKTCVC